MQRFNLELDLWELQILVDHLSLDETSFKDEDLSVDGVKVYDEDGNSDWLGVLSVNTETKTQAELDELQRVLDIAKDNLYETIEKLNN